MRRAHAERIQFYDDRVRETVERLQREFDTESLPDALWQDIKLQYVGLLTNHRQPELAETFFNTVSCKILHRTYYHNDFIFVRPAVSTEYLEADPPSYRSYYPLQNGLRTVLRQILRDLDLHLPFADCAAGLPVTCCAPCALTCRAASGWRRTIRSRCCPRCSSATGALI